MLHKPVRSTGICSDGTRMMPDQRPGPVLVIDDHAINLKLLQRVLELEGLDIVTADSLAAAARVLRHARPPVIVLDVRLPDGNGLDFARKLKADPATAKCAIVACTAATMTGEEQQALDAGCDAFVSKPIDTRPFGELIASLMPAPGGSGAARRADQEPAGRVSLAARA